MGTPADADGDGFSACAGDCNDGNGVVWATPGEALDVEFAADARTMQWAAPADPGGLWARYDTIRSADAADFMTLAVCVETDDASDTMATDPDAPPAGGAFYYLIRAENDCPSGRGTLGARSDGTPVLGRDCP